MGTEIASASEVDPFKTGAPGRPTMSHVIKAQFEIRCKEAIVEPTLHSEATALLAWAKEHHPRTPLPTHKTIENQIRSAYRQHKNGG